MKIAVIGLGYVGLPLAKALAKKFQIVGFDINQKRIKELNNGYDSTNELTSDQVKESLNKNIIASAYFLISIFTLINLPLKNPYEFDFRSQKVLNQRKNMIENPEKYSDIDRKNARNGFLIKEE